MPEFREVALDHEPQVAVERVVAGPGWRFTQAGEARSDDLVSVVGQSDRAVPTDGGAPACQEIRDRYGRWDEAALMLDEVVAELGRGNRLEFRDFGVFETKVRKARKAQNPKTLEPVEVPEKRTVKLKVGRLMKQRLAEMTGAAIDDEATDVAEMSEHNHDDEHDEDEAEEHTQEQAGT